jgi:hypothetical protein
VVEVADQSIADHSKNYEKCCVVFFAFFWSLLLMSSSSSLGYSHTHVSHAFRITVPYYGTFVKSRNRPSFVHLQRDAKPPNLF